MKTRGKRAEVQCFRSDYQGSTDGKKGKKRHIQFSAGLPMKGVNILPIKTMCTALLCSPERLQRFIW